MWKDKIKNQIYYSTGETNWFHITLIALLGIAVLILTYLAYLATVLNIREINATIGFQQKPPPVTLSLASDEQFYPNGYAVGDEVEVALVIDAPLQKVNGMDVVLAYDPSALEIKPVNPGGSIDRERYLDTTFSDFDIFPSFQVDENRGRITFSALVRPLRSFVGSGKVAGLKFTTLKSGATNVNFIYQPNNSFDTNVAYLGDDVLRKVENLTIQVR